jgi:hypothetical protein
MLFERDDPIPRDDQAVIVWQRLILVFLVLAAVCVGLTTWFLGSAPVDALPPFTTTAIDFYVV